MINWIKQLVYLIDEGDFLGEVQEGEMGFFLEERTLMKKHKLSVNK